MVYCTSADVLAVIPSFVATVDDDIIDVGTIDGLCQEASARVRMILSPRFSISLIEAYNPLPEGVIYLTAITAGKLLLERHDAISADRSKTILEFVEREEKLWLAVVFAGTLIAPDGSFVPRLVSPSSRSTLTVLGDTIETLYRNGTRVI